MNKSKKSLQVMSAMLPLLMRDQIADDLFIIENRPYIPTPLFNLGDNSNLGYNRLKGNNSKQKCVCTCGNIFKISKHSDYGECRICGKRCYK